MIGSGVRGQSYLYWHGDQLYELPVSYWSDGSRWINSPGYKNGTMNFSRAAIPRCLECHATYIEPRLPGSSDQSICQSKPGVGDLLRALPRPGRGPRFAAPNQGVCSGWFDRRSNSESG